MDRYGVQVMQLLPALPYGDNKACRFQNVKVFGYPLTRHIEMFAQIRQRLPVMHKQTVEPPPAAGISERFETSFILLK